MSRYVPCDKAVMPYKEETKVCRIILTSSITGPITGYPGWAVWSKWKLLNWKLYATAATGISSHMELP